MLYGQHEHDIKNDNCITVWIVRSSNIVACQRGLQQTAWTATRHGPCRNPLVRPKETNRTFDSPWQVTIYYDIVW